MERKKLYGTSNPNFKHGLTESRLYSIWTDMKTRCYNKNRAAYERYGERGIGIDYEVWRYDFISFNEWAMSNGYADNLTLERIDNSKGYSPENCRWATYKEQNNNKRDNHYISYNGKTKTLSEWAEIYNINKRTLSCRILRHNWSIEKALTTPVIKYNKRSI